MVTDMLTLLQVYPKARERRYKNHATASLLQKKYKFLNEVDIPIIADMVAEANSLDREWRKILERQPLLRGRDYPQGKKLAKVKQAQLGYTV